MDRHKLGIVLIIYNKCLHYHKQCYLQIYFPTGDRETFLLTRTSANAEDVETEIPIIDAMLVSHRMTKNAFLSVQNAGPERYTRLGGEPQ